MRESRAPGLRGPTVEFTGIGYNQAQCRYAGLTTSHLSGSDLGVTAALPVFLPPAPTSVVPGPVQLLEASAWRAGKNTHVNMPFITQLVPAHG